MFKLNNANSWGRIFLRSFLPFPGSSGFIMNFVSDRTRDKILAWLRDYGTEDNRRPVRGGGSSWVIVQCDDDVPLANVDNIQEQLFPATVIVASENITYPDSDDLTGDTFGIPVLLTVLSGVRGTDGPIWEKPRKGKLYAGVMTGRVEIDSAGSLKGRPRVVAASPETTDKLKASVHVATTAALAANTYDNGESGRGATLTGNANGELSVEGSILTGYDVLVKNEANAAHNGIYTVTTLGTISTPYVLTRRADADSPDDFNGALVFVRFGTVNGKTLWACEVSGPITVGTDGIAWDKVGPTLTGSGTNGHAVRWSGTANQVTDSAVVISDAGDVITPGVILSYDSVGGEKAVQLSTVPNSAVTLFVPTVGGITYSHSMYAASKDELYFNLASGAKFTIPITSRFCVDDMVGGRLVGAAGSDSLGNEFHSGIITSIGTGVAVTLSAANVFTNTQTIHAGANVPALSLQQTSSNASNTLTLTNIAGTITFAVTGAGDVTAAGGITASGVVTAASFSGSGSGLTSIPAGQLTGTIDGGSW